MWCQETQWNCRVLGAQNEPQKVCSTELLKALPSSLFSQTHSWRQPHISCILTDRSENHIWWRLETPWTCPLHCSEGWCCRTKPTQVIVCRSPWCTFSESIFAPYSNMHQLFRTQAMFRTKRNLNQFRGFGHGMCSEGLDIWKPKAMESAWRPLTYFQLKDILSELTSLSAGKCFMVFVLYSHQISGMSALTQDHVDIDSKLRWQDVRLTAGHSFSLTASSLIGTLFQTELWTLHLLERLRQDLLLYLESDSSTSMQYTAYQMSQSKYHRVIY